MYELNEIDIFGENTTKLSEYETTIEPNLKLSTMLYEAMLESLDSDMKITEAMMKADLTELRFRRNNIEESAIEAIHEGVISNIFNFIVNGIKWIISKVGSFFKMIFSAVTSFFRKIGEKISEWLGNKNSKEAEKAKEEVKKIEEKLNINTTNSEEPVKDVKEAIEKAPEEVIEKVVETIANSPEGEVALAPLTKTWYDRVKTTGDEVLDKINNYVNSPSTANKLVRAGEVTINGMDKAGRLVRAASGTTLSFVKVLSKGAVNSFILKYYMNKYNKSSSRLHDRFKSQKIEWYSGDTGATPINLFSFASSALGKISVFDLPVNKPEAIYKFCNKYDNSEAILKEYGFNEARELIEKDKKDLGPLKTNFAISFATFRNLKKLSSNLINQIKTVQNNVNDKIKKIEEKVNKIAYDAQHTTSGELLDNPKILRKSAHKGGAFGKKLIADKSLTNIYSEVVKRFNIYKQEFIKLCKEINDEIKERAIRYNTACKEMQDANHRSTHIKDINTSVNLNLTERLDKTNLYSYQNNASTISFDDIALSPMRESYMDSDFIKEMAEYEIDELFENTYTDYDGRIVCNF